MKTDKEIMLAFQEQFNTGRLFTETQVLILMGMARGEAKRSPEKRVMDYQCPFTEEKCIKTDPRDERDCHECSNYEV